MEAQRRAHNLKSSGHYLELLDQGRDADAVHVSPLLGGQLKVELHRLAEQVAAAVVEPTRAVAC